MDYACGVDGRGGNGDGVGEGGEKGGREDHGGGEREHDDLFIWVWRFGDLNISIELDVEALIGRQMCKCLLT